MDLETIKFFFLGLIQGLTGADSGFLQRPSLDVVPLLWSRT